MTNEQGRLGPGRAGVRYRQIHAQLREQIVSGHYRAGDRLPTEMELTVLYGVSRTTTAAAMAELARDGLVRRAPRRGTIVLPQAPRMARARADARPLVAWIQPEIDHPFGLDLLRGVERATRQAGHDVLLYLTGTSLTDEEQAIRQALAAGAAAIVLYPQDGETYNAEVLRLFLDSHPIVLVDRRLRGLSCAYVQSDNVSGARAIVDQLIVAGHRHICAAVFPSTATSTIEDRLNGYRQALATAGLPQDLTLIYQEEEHLHEIQSTGDVLPGVVERFARYLGTRPEITAVFATNAPLALLTLRAVERLGLRIPDDFSVVCIDALQSFPFTLPSFTCARQQSFALGLAAVELVQEALQGKAPRHVVLPMQIEDFGSVRAPQPRHR